MVVYTSREAEENAGIFSSEAFGAVLLLMFFSAFFVACWYVALDIVGLKNIDALALLKRRPTSGSLAPIDDTPPTPPTRG